MKGGTRIGGVKKEQVSFMGEARWHGQTAITQAQKWGSAPGAPGFRSLPFSGRAGISGAPTQNAARIPYVMKTYKGNYLVKWHSICVCMYVPCQIFIEILF